MIVFQQNKPLYSIFSVNFHALIMIIASGYTSPMVNLQANRMELCNETFVLITTYHLYQFTDFMTDPYNRRIVGFSLIIITCFNVILNIGLIVISTMALVIRKLKLKYLAYK